MMILFHPDAMMEFDGEMFGWIWDEWKEKSKNSAHQAEMKRFIEKECSDWSKHQ